VLFCGALLPLEGTLLEKLRKIEELHAGTNVDGEREAARRAAEPRGRMQIGARVDIMRQARGDDRQDGRGALCPLIEPCEEPILTTENQSSELALATIIRQLDLSVLEEKREPLPLAVQVSETASEGCLGWRYGALVVEPRAQLVEDRLRECMASGASLFGTIAGECRRALDREQARDDLHPFERDLIAGAHAGWHHASRSPRVGGDVQPGRRWRLHARGHR
jgi:hypothetical protein